MVDGPNPVLRSHILHRLVRLTPDNTDIASLDQFVLERAAILSELEAIDAPWTQQERDILAAAMRHAENVMAELETIHKQIAQQINGLHNARSWGAGHSKRQASRISKRY